MTIGIAQINKITLGRLLQKLVIGSKEYRHPQFTQVNSESYQLQMPQYIHFVKHNSRPQCPAVY